jgi:hypothetical protein
VYHAKSGGEPANDGSTAWLIRMVRDRVIAGDVTFGPHIWEHSKTEGFGYIQIREAILEGQIIDWMRDRQRLLFCSRVRNDHFRYIWLHVVVEYLGPERAGLVTAYSPDPSQWDDPPLRRRR